MRPLTNQHIECRAYPSSALLFQLPQRLDPANRFRIIHVMPNCQCRLHPIRPTGHRFRIAQFQECRLKPCCDLPDQSQNRYSLLMKNRSFQPVEAVLFLRIIRLFLPRRQPENIKKEVATESNLPVLNRFHSHRFGLAIEARRNETIFSAQTG